MFYCQCLAVVLLHLLVTGECLNTYQFNMLFDQNIGVKSITCIHIRLSDVTTGEHYDFSRRYTGIEYNYYESIYETYEHALTSHMNHQYKVQVTVNNDWCSFLNDNPASVRSGDLQSKSLIRIHGSPKFHGEMHYKFNVKMEHVK